MKLRSISISNAVVVAACLAALLSTQVAASEPAALGKSLATSKLVIGYWHDWSGTGAPTVKLVDVPAYYNVVCVAFASTTDNKTMSFDVDPSVETEAQFIADVKTLQARGTKVLLSMGGQNSVVVLNNASDKTVFVQTMDSIIKKFGFNGIDLDLENDVFLGAGDTDFKNPTSGPMTNLISAVRQIHDDCGGANFVLTAAPEVAFVQGAIVAFASTWGCYLPILWGLRDIMTCVYTTLYNTGSNPAPDGQSYSEGTADFIVAMTDMLIGGFGIAGSTTNVFPGLPASQVAFGLPATTAAGAGFTQFSDAVKALDYLTKGTSYGGKYVLRKSGGYPDLKGIMTWSINWDAGNSYTFGKTFSNYFGVSTPVTDAPQHSVVVEALWQVEGDRIVLNGSTRVSSIQIVTLSGVTVRSIASPGRAASLAGLRNGSYIVKAETPNGIVTKKMVACGFGQ